MLSHTAVFNLGEVSSLDDRGQMPLPEKKVVKNLWERLTSRDGLVVAAGLQGRISAAEIRL